MTDSERQYYEAQRQALLQQVDAIERLCNITPRTAELRQAWKRGKVAVHNEQPERSAEDDE